MAAILSRGDELNSSRRDLHCYSFHGALWIMRYSMKDTISRYYILQTLLFGMIIQTDNWHFLGSTVCIVVIAFLGREFFFAV